MNKTSDIDKATRTAAKLFTAKLTAYPVAKLLLFGSRARGDFHVESDADIAVLLKGKAQRFLPTKLALADIAYDVLLETGIRIQPLPIWEEEWQSPDQYSNPYLLRNIEHEGVPL